MNYHNFGGMGGCPAAFPFHHDTKFLPSQKCMLIYRADLILLCCHNLETLVANAGRSKAAVEQVTYKDYNLVITQLKL